MPSSHEVSQEQALAFVEALVGFRQFRSGYRSAVSPDALVHLEAVLGRSNVPYDVDLDDIQNSIGCGMVTSEGGPEFFKKGLKRMKGLANYLHIVAGRLDEVLVEPEKWVQQLDEEQERRERERR